MQFVKLLTTFFYSTLFLIYVSAQALYDSPCYGKCEYTLDLSEQNMQATLIMEGPPNSISDITPAAGWHILDCQPDVVEQKIRVVCTDAEHCNNLYDGGAPGTIVRLTDECASTPYAVVANSTVASDQSLPEEIKARLARRDSNGDPLVKELTLKRIQNGSGRQGNVTFRIVATTSNEFPEEVASLARRSFDEFADIAPHDLFSRRAFGIDDYPIHFQQNHTFLDGDVLCANNTKLHLSVSAGVYVNGKVGAGLVVSGSIFPPHISEFNLFTAFTGDVEATLKLGLIERGTIQDIALAELGIPALAFPGILTVGPVFKVFAGTSASAEIGVDLDVTLKYSSPDTKVYWPDSSKNTGALTPRDSPLTLSVSEMVHVQGTLEGHVRARMEFDVLAFGGLVGKADVYLGLEAYAKLTMDVRQQTTVSATHHTDTPADDPPLMPRSIAGRRLPGIQYGSLEGDQQVTDLSTGSFTTKASGSESACTELKLGLGAYVGAEGTLLDLIETGAQVKIWGQEWSVLKKCVSSNFTTSEPTTSLPLVNSTVTSLPQANYTAASLPQVNSTESTISTAYPSDSIGSTFTTSIPIPDDTKNTSTTKDTNYSTHANIPTPVELAAATTTPTTPTTATTTTTKFVTITITPPSPSPYASGGSTTTTTAADLRPSDVEQSIPQSDQTQTQTTEDTDTTTYPIIPIPVHRYPAPPRVYSPQARSHSSAFSARRGRRHHHSHHLRRGVLPPITGPGGYIPPTTGPGGYVPPTTSSGGYMPPNTGGYRPLSTGPGGPAVDRPMNSNVAKMYCQDPTLSPLLTLIAGIVTAEQLLFAAAP